MITKLQTTTPLRRGIASFRNKNANFYFYYPYKDKSKRVRNSLTIRKSDVTLTLHGKEINSLIALLKKANKI